MKWQKKLSISITWFVLANAIMLILAEVILALTNKRNNDLPYMLAVLVISGVLATVMLISYTMILLVWWNRPQRLYKKLGFLK